MCKRKKIEQNCKRDDDKNIVVCKDTNLEWQDDSNASSTSTNWQDAINYCENLELNGKDDWRLPNVNELKSIIDYTKSNPSINSAFKNTATSYCWTSTSYAPKSGYAWSVDFGRGFVNAVDKTGSIYVRCVRQ